MADILTFSLSEMCSKLEHALTFKKNPALLRLPENERTLEGLVSMYMPRSAEFRTGPRSFEWIDLQLHDWSNLKFSRHHVRANTFMFDLTDPGTARALPPLLALALGLDPGPGGRACCWRALHTGIGKRERIGWWLDTAGDHARFYVTTENAMAEALDEVINDDIANEPDDLRALVMACKLAGDQ